MISEQEVLEIRKKLNIIPYTGKMRLVKKFRLKGYHTKKFFSVFVFHTLEDMKNVIESRKNGCKSFIPNNSLGLIAFTKESMTMENVAQKVAGATVCQFKSESEVANKVDSKRITRIYTKLFKGMTRKLYKFGFWKPDMNILSGMSFHGDMPKSFHT